jgi:hypothetical protein
MTHEQTVATHDTATFPQGGNQGVVTAAIDGNNFDDRVVPAAAGVIATTFALNELICKGHDAARENMTS